MRYEGHGWDPKGPASIHRARAALDKDGAVIGYVFGHWLGNLITSGYPLNQPGGGAPDTNNTPIVLGYLFLVIGWLAGMGIFNDLVRQMRGRPIADEHAEATGLARYFRFTLDHKVVGIQYLIGMIIYFCTAGLLAMGIRTELLSPVHHVFSSSVYAEIVGEHGSMRMMLMTSVILGPFGNYLIPLMIGSKRVAYPGLRRCRSGSRRLHS